MIKFVLQLKITCIKKPPQFSVCTLGQMHHLQEKGWDGWYSEYFLQR